MTKFFFNESKFLIFFHSVWHFPFFHKNLWYYSTMWLKNFAIDWYDEKKLHGTEFLVSPQKFRQINVLLKNFTTYVYCINWFDEKKLHGSEFISSSTLYCDVQIAQNLYEINALKNKAHCRLLSRNFSHDFHSLQHTSHTAVLCVEKQEIVYQANRFFRQINL